MLLQLMTRPPQQVWFVVFPGSELLDLAGPWAVLGYASEILGKPAYAAQLFTAGRGEIRTRHGLALSGARSLGRAAACGVPDTLVVAGGSPTTMPSAEAKTARWLRRHHRRIVRVISICTGAFVLGEAGLLDGRRATTHWQYLDLLRQRFPKVRTAADEIFLRDGRIWTSAGVTAGIDLMLALVEEDHGHAVAMSVAKNLVLFLRRSGRQAQFSQLLKRQEREPGELRDLVPFILEHLPEPLPVERLAQEVGMSPRTLTRWCERELGESPAALVRRLRLEEAQRLLEQTSAPLKDIASRTFIGDSSTLWRIFVRHLGVTPAEYRSRFSASLRAPR
jgi:transcriptional regulator GlxA family with amidase domain